MLIDDSHVVDEKHPIRKDLGEEPEDFLWRFIIVGPHHGKGFGRRAIELLVDYVRTLPGATELLVSCGQGEGSPEEFYLKMGFKHNGKMYGVVAVGDRRVSR